MDITFVDICSSQEVSGGVLRRMHRCDVPTFLDQAYDRAYASIEARNGWNDYLFFDQFYITDEIHPFNGPALEYCRNRARRDELPVFICLQRPDDCAMTERIETDIIDEFGAYFPARDGRCAYIELYLERINASAADDDSFRRLIALVLLHEVAHAVLYPFILHPVPNPIIRLPYNTEFGRWREESMANAIALQCIRETGDAALYDYARRVVSTQPPEYALGGVMCLPGASGYKSVLRRKTEGQQEVLQVAWLSYARGRPTPEGLERWNDILLRDDADAAMP